MGSSACLAAALVAWMRVTRAVHTPSREGMSKSTDSSPPAKLSPSQSLSLLVPLEVPVDVPEDVPELVPELVPDEVPELVPEEVPELVPLLVPLEVPELVPLDVPELVPLEVPLLLEIAFFSSSELEPELELELEDVPLLVQEDLKPCQVVRSSRTSYTAAAVSSAPWLAARVAFCNT